MRGEESQNSQALTVNTLVVAMDIQHLAARERQQFIVSCPDPTLHSPIPRPHPSQSHTQTPPLATKRSGSYSHMLLVHNRWSHDQVLQYHVRSHDQVLEYHVRSHDQVLEYHVRSHDLVLEYHVRSHDQVLQYHVRSHDQVLEYHVRSHDQVLSVTCRSHDQHTPVLPASLQVFQHGDFPRVSMSRQGLHRF